MDKLLNWSIAQQSGDKEAIEKIGQPDEKLLSQLFGAPDEPALMRQAIQVIENPESTLEAKEIAFDNFEMLIENLDNANNIENLKLWPSIINILESDEPSLRIGSASVIGSAVQNNPKSQDDFYNHNGLSKLIDVLSSKDDNEFKMKVLFSISSVIRNHSNSLKQFNDLNGWDIIEFGNNEKATIRNLSIISSILSNQNHFDDFIKSNLHEKKIVDKLLDSLDSFETKPENNQVADKSFNILSQLLDLKFDFNNDHLNKLSQVVPKFEKVKDQLDDYNKVTSAL